MKTATKFLLLVCPALLAGTLLWTACNSNSESSIPEKTTGKQTTAASTTVKANDTTPPDQEAHIHTFSDWTTILSPACEKEGLQQRYCIDCQYTESSSIDAGEHTMEIIPATKATCTAYATKEGYYCTLCGKQEIPVDYSNIPAGHQLSSLDSEHICCELCNLRSDLLYSAYSYSWKYFYVEYGSYETWEDNMAPEIDKYMYYDILVPRHDYITSILPTLFQNSQITAITMTDNISSIGSSAFEDCTELAFVSLPATIEKIDSRAFANCSALLHIQFEGTVDEWNAIEKEADWDAGTGNYTVYCSNGTVSK